jgi:alpha-D-ribose 1-methylphosphonate 5-triphosphate synthase subunit PhnH
VDGSLAIPWLQVAEEDPAPGTFQAVLTALEHPGTAVRLPTYDGLPWPLNSASAALLAAWVNPETPVWTDLCCDSAAAAWLQRTCACSLVTEPCMARVAFISESSRTPPLGQFHLGEDDRLERSTTVILQVSGFSSTADRRRAVSGSGRALRAETGLPPRFWSEWKEQRRFLPFGIDVFFTCADTMVALPRGLQI